MIASSTESRLLISLWALGGLEVRGFFFYFFFFFFFFSFLGMVKEGGNEEESGVGVGAGGSLQLHGVCAWIWEYVRTSVRSTSMAMA